MLAIGPLILLTVQLDRIRTVGAIEDVSRVSVVGPGRIPNVPARSRQPRLGNPTATILPLLTGIGVGGPENADHSLTISIVVGDDVICGGNVHFAVIGKLTRLIPRTGPMRSFVPFTDWEHIVLGVCRPEEFETAAQGSIRQLAQSLVADIVRARRDQQEHRVNPVHQTSVTPTPR